ncbi:MAG: hypothetical protein HQL01_15145, partial [Nitrospirae bacterium]|nr:hypothetical protein [Nitrospirota bacterium]
CCNLKKAIFCLDNWVHYTLTLEPITSPSQTVVVVECKQYQKASVENFSSALIDYANGRPNAKVLIVNYSNIPQSIWMNIDSQLKTRVAAIGEFIPIGRDKRNKAFDDFSRLITESIPRPTAKQMEVTGIANGISFNIIAVDISSSMETILNEKRYQEALRLLIHASPSAMLIAIDTKVIRKWQKAEDGYEELIAMPKVGATDLPVALSSYDMSKAVIVTDSDGMIQLQRRKIHHYMVIVF